MMTKIKCLNCGRTLLYQDVISGIVEVKCTRSNCGVINRIETKENKIEQTRGTDFNKNISHKNQSVL